jgi:hypothetical protein
VTDDHHRLAVEARQSADDGVIVGKRAVAVQLFEIGKDQLQVIERIRPLRMPRDLRNLPRSELGVDLLGQRLALLLKLGDLFGDIDRSIVLRRTQRFDLAFEVGNCSKSRKVVFITFKDGPHSRKEVAPRRTAGHRTRVFISTRPAADQDCATDTR